MYWLIFGWFAAGALAAPLNTDQAAAVRRPAFAISGVVVAALIGFRYRVGADWFNYEAIFRWVARNTFVEALASGDPAYQALNWFAFQAGAEIWLVNFVCGLCFTWGLFRFCAGQPLPWAAALVSVPYIIIVVAMGYTRQGVALGFLMAGLAAFLQGASTARFAFYVLAAALFHKTAVIAFPIVALASNRNRTVNFLLVVAGSVALYDFFLGDALENFVTEYIRGRYSSQGAAIRVGMSIIAATLFWTLGRKLRFSELEQRLWRNFSLATFGLLALLLLLPSSTVVDRLSIYIMPLQIAVLARLPLAFTTKVPGVLVLSSYLFAVQFVWLTYATHSEYWLPYAVFPLIGWS